jgi:hypothetical protein
VEKFVVMHSGNIGLSQALETVVQAADALRTVGDLEMIQITDGPNSSEFRVDDPRDALCKRVEAC